MIFSYPSNLVQMAKLMKITLAATRRKQYGL